VLNFGPVSGSDYQEKSSARFPIKYLFLGIDFKMLSLRPQKLPKGKISNANHSPAGTLVREDFQL
jgi:hypothetical protein